MKSNSWLVLCAPMCIVSFILSVISLACRYPSSSSIDYLGIIVAILALLVTILIGWQIAQSLYAEDRLRNAVDKVRSETGKDSVHIIRGFSEIQNARVYMMFLQDADKFLDCMFASIKHFSECTNTDTSSALIDDCFETILSYLDKPGKDGEYTIPTDKVEQFLSILKRIHNHRTEEVARILRQATSDKVHF